MTKKIFLISLSAFLTLWLGCAKSCQKPNLNDTADTSDAAALINGKSVSLAKLETLHKKSLSHMQRTGQNVGLDVERKMRASILRRMLDEELIKQKAEALKINIDEQERKDALEAYKTRIGGEKAYEAMMRQGTVSEEQIIENLSSDMIRKKILQKLGNKISISDEEIAGYYQANQNQYMMPEMVHARHILLKVTNTDTPEKVEEVKNKALTILEEAKKPGANFIELAEKYSEGPSQKQGGDLGFFGRGRMVKEFEDAVFQANEKSIVGPIKTDFGFHIVFVEEKKAPHTASLEEVKPKIVESLTRNKEARQGEDILNKLREDAQIKIIDYSMTNEEYSEAIKQQKEPKDQRAAKKE